MVGSKEILSATRILSEGAVFPWSFDYSLFLVHSLQYHTQPSENQHAKNLDELSIGDSL